VEPSKEPCIALAKLLSTCFVIRGTQLSVVGRLEGKVVVDIQMSLLAWIGKRLGVFENSGNKRLRNKAADFFKVLLPLLSTIDSRDALKM
jgi:cohesin complex subunit SA-1/2